MPTSDPIRRRQQNRENQKKFRKKQLQNLADLRAAYEAQSLRLQDAERKIQRLTEQLEALRQHINPGACILPDVHDAHDFAAVVSHPVAADDDGSSANTGSDFSSETAGAFDPSLHVLPELMVGQQAVLDSPDLFIMPENVDHTTNDDADDWLDIPLLDTDQTAESTAVARIDAARTNSLDLCGWNMGVVTHARDNIRACLLAEYNNSRLSKHIVTANSLIQQEYNERVPKLNMSSFKAVADAVAWIMQSWSTSVGALEMMSTLQELRNYEIWRNFPTEANLKRIHPMYRPTIAQILCPHAPALDWLPWPTLRDKAIELQHTLNIDMVNTKALFHTVLDCTSQGPKETRTESARVWDIYSLAQSNAISATATHNPNAFLSGVTRPGSRCTFQPPPRTCLFRILSCSVES